MMQPAKKHQIAVCRSLICTSLLRAASVGRKCACNYCQRTQGNVLAIQLRTSFSAAHTAQLAERVWFKLSGETRSRKLLIY